MVAPLVLAFLTVAFPKEGATLDGVRQCMVIGATNRGISEVVVNGVTNAVYRTGSFATAVACTDGTNTLTVVAGTNTLTRSFFVRPPQSAAAAAEAKPKPYERLDYATGKAQGAPTGKTPGETLVWLDPGHGGPDDLGTVSPRGFPEKQVNLLVARIVRDELVKLGYRVEMTRDADVAVPLLERARAAHVRRADCFVSIHHNAPAVSANPSEVRYTAVYAWWSGVGDSLASAIEQELALAFAGEIESKGVLHANFAVTRSPQIPSCLVEVDFVTHPAGEEAIWNADHRAFIGRAIALGIHRWCRGE